MKRASKLTSIVLGTISALTPMNVDSCQTYTTPTFPCSPSITIIEPCTPELNPPMIIYPDRQPNLLQRIQGHWNAEASYKTGFDFMDSQGIRHIKTPQIILKQPNEYIHFNSNGTCVESCEGRLISSFYGVTYDPHNSHKGTITFYSQLNPHIIRSEGDIEVSDEAIRISNSDGWNHTFRRR